MRIEGGAGPEEGVGWNIWAEMSPGRGLRDRVCVIRGRDLPRGGASEILGLVDLGGRLGR